MLFKGDWVACIRFIFMNISCLFSGRDILDTYKQDLSKIEQLGEFMSRIKYALNDITVSVSKQTIYIFYTMIMDYVTKMFDIFSF